MDFNEGHYRFVTTLYEDKSIPSEADAEFIVHARQDLPALLDENDELRADRDRWKVLAEALGNDLINANMNLDHITERVEELERFIGILRNDGSVNPCTGCTYDNKIATEKGCSYNGKCWQFDAARFSGDAP